MKFERLILMNAKNTGAFAQMSKSKTASVVNEDQITSPFGIAQ